MDRYDVIVIGGGPAGLSAAISAYDEFRAKGVEKPSVLVLERDVRLGGILNQCIHNGFGLHTFKEELTGPEYALRYINMLRERNIEFMLQTMVMSITGDRRVTAMNRQRGMFEMECDSLVLSMGCRERARGALNIPGYRPAGIYSAGTAQRLVNMEGFMPGREVVILGSGDIGLIMARRMTLEGARVLAVAELMPYSGGLKRNIVQCLDDFGIPLLLSHTVVDIKGKERVEGLVIAEVDASLKPIPGTEKEYKCDTLLLSCGLLPENELSNGAGIEMNPVTNGPKVNESMETGTPGVYACGNVLHVHDLVDYVSEEAALAGRCAADHSMRLKEKAEAYDRDDDTAITVTTGNGVRYTVPVCIRPKFMDETVTIRFRVGNVYRNCFVDAYIGDERVLHRKKQVVSPGEMENVILKKEQLTGASGNVRIEICTE
ncbi:MAG: NAD(P)/FAD-dependent oxidoreductase [Lachnospiraceae bacterium]|nr:NAD(P)/FAD-dependent oxidoreductase [Lachnospiraceae bacterium]